MKKLILKWLGIDTLNNGLLRTVVPDTELGFTPNFRIGLIKTMNGGTVLEIGTFKPNARGSDWTYEFYSVDPEQKLSEAVGIVLTMKGLEQ